MEFLPTNFLALHTTGQKMHHLLGYYPDSQITLKQELVQDRQIVLWYAKWHCQMLYTAIALCWLTAPGSFILSNFAMSHIYNWK